MPVEISTLALGPSALGRRFTPGEGINAKAEVNQSVSVPDYLPGPNVLMPRMRTTVDAYI